MTLRLRTYSVCFLGICLVLSGCRRQPASSGLTPVRLQTDWYPQPEHGGFYDAQIRGYYKDEGLDVTILPGGPYVNTTQLVSAGTVQFAMGSSDNTLESIGNGVPLVAVSATMQHDPQAIMVHQDSPIHSFQDLDGHAIAIRLGASTWFEYLVKRYQLKKCTGDSGDLQRCQLPSGPRVHSTDIRHLGAVLRTPGGRASPHPAHQPGWI